ncbi:hypothetical protein [uncultured Endozoicomonas sp.]|uniref:hypothetical protein n=1 Tax=uncultured Endozoicomonas sp. TaxID=432652 RepID=UPI002634EBB9|nr:hypothetical protein [uncultured Endozoicomonas sp.]
MSPYNLQPPQPFYQPCTWPLNPTGHDVHHLPPPFPYGQIMLVADPVSHMGGFTLAPQQAQESQLYNMVISQPTHTSTYIPKPPLIEHPATITDIAGSALNPCAPEFVSQHNDQLKMLMGDEVINIQLPDPAFDPDDQSSDLLPLWNAKEISTTAIRSLAEAFTKKKHFNVDEDMKVIFTHKDEASSSKGKSNKTKQSKIPDQSILTSPARKPVVESLTRFMEDSQHFIDSGRELVDNLKDMAASKCLNAHTMDTSHSKQQKSTTVSPIAFFDFIITIFSTPLQSTKSSLYFSPLTAFVIPYDITTFPKIDMPKQKIGSLSSALMKGVVKNSPENQIHIITSLIRIMAETFPKKLLSYQQGKLESSVLLLHIEFINHLSLLAARHLNTEVRISNTRQAADSLNLLTVLMIKHISAIKQAYPKKMNSETYTVLLEIVRGLLTLMNTEAMKSLFSKPFSKIMQHNHNQSIKNIEILLISIIKTSLKNNENFKFSIASLIALAQNPELLTDTTDEKERSSLINSLSSLLIAFNDYICEHNIYGDKESDVQTTDTIRTHCLLPIIQLISKLSNRSAQTNGMLRDLKSAICWLERENRKLDNDTLTQNYQSIQFLVSEAASLATLVSLETKRTGFLQHMQALIKQYSTENQAEKGIAFKPVRKRTKHQEPLIGKCKNTSPSLPEQRTTENSEADFFKKQDTFIESVNSVTKKAVASGQYPEIIAYLKEQLSDYFDTPANAFWILIETAGQILQPLPPRIQDIRVSIDSINMLYENSRTITEPLKREKLPRHLAIKWLNENGLQDLTLNSITVATSKFNPTTLTETQSRISDAIHILESALESAKHIIETVTKNSNQHILGNLTYDDVIGNIYFINDLLEKLEKWCHSISQKCYLKELLDYRKSLLKDIGLYGQTSKNNQSANQKMSNANMMKLKRISQKLDTSQDTSELNARLGTVKTIHSELTHRLHTEPHFQRANNVHG